MRRLISAWLCLLPATGQTLTLLQKSHVDPASFPRDSAGPVDAPKGSVTGASFSFDGTRLVAGDFKATAHVYDVARDGASLTPLFRAIHGVGTTGVDGEIGPAMFSPDAARFATGINAKGVKIWNVATGLADPDRTLETGDSEHHFHPNRTCDGANWSADGKWFAAGAQNVLKVFRVPSFDEVVSFPHPGNPRWEVNSVDFTRHPGTGELLMISGSGSGTSGTVLVHRLVAGVWTEQYRWSDSSDPATTPSGSSWLGGIGGSVKSVRFSPDGALWGIGCRSAVSRVYRTDNGAVVTAIPASGNTQWLAGDDEDPNAAVEAVEWSSCGNYFLNGGLIDGVMRVWRRADWSLAAWVQTQCTLGPVAGRSDEGLRAIEFLDVFQDRILVGGDEGTVQIYRLETPPLRAPFEQVATAGAPLLIEAEAAHSRVAQGLPGPVTTFTDARGIVRQVASLKDGLRNWADADDSTAIQALPEDGFRYDSDYHRHNPRTDSPRADYRITFHQTGTHYVWVKAFAANERGNSCHVGLDNTALESGTAVEVPTFGAWTWANSDAAGSRRTVEIPTSGVHTLHLWMCESGLKIDQILLTTDPAWVPSPRP